jgi:hypothetical protein
MNKKMPFMDHLAKIFKTKPRLVISADELLPDAGEVPVCVIEVLQQIECKHKKGFNLVNINNILREECNERCGFSRLLPN